MISVTVEMYMTHPLHCRRCCSERHDRHTWKSVAKGAQFHVLGTKVVAPFGDTVCLKKIGTFNEALDDIHTSSTTSLFNSPWA